MSELKHSDASSVGARTVEEHGVDTIPLDERVYRPYHILTTMYGGNLSYSIIIFGSFPILFGLGWWASVASIVVGCFVGGLVLAPMGLFGPKTGTNNPVSSGAHFGIAGRFIGTALALFSALGFVALTIWTGGDALSSSVARAGIQGSPDLQRAIGYGVLAAIVLYVCVRGVHLVVWVQKTLMVPVMSLVLLAGVVAFAPRFDASYAGGELAFGSFSITWIASTLLIASLIVSYAGFIGDYARYIPPGTAPGQLLGMTMLAAMSVVVPVLWGAYIASTFPADAGLFVTSLVAQAPGWYLPGLLLLALLAGVAQGAIGLYGTGLDASSLIPRLTRRQATVLIAAVATTLVYVGAFVWDAIATVNAFLILLLTVSAPWAAIMAIGYMHCRGYYYPADLQVFTHGRKGGRYWYRHGWDWRAAAAWAAGSLVGILFGAAPPLYTGPFVDIAGGADVSFVLSLGVGAVLYAVFLLVSPSPHFVFGPDGPRFGRVRQDVMAEPVSESATAGVTAPDGVSVQ